MLRSLKDLKRYTVSATDGGLGKVVNFLFDDERWAIRYLVVEPNLFHLGHDVLISPVFFRQADWETRTFHLALTKERVRNSPSVDSNRPVSRQHERDYFRYYGYPYYWGYSGVWGLGNLPGLLAPWDEPPKDREALTGDVHLRSAREVGGYSIEASDGPLGRVTDFVIDDRSWEIRYIVVDANPWWWIAKKVVVAPQWAAQVSWVERTVTLSMSRAAIRTSPPWDPRTPVNREYEARLHDYYGRPAYWVDADRPGEKAKAQPMGSHPG